MKGTIDIQIKRKDGSIENRHEHNVIFDIPSLTFAKWSESPLAIATGVPTQNVTLADKWFSTFCLSGDTISTTEPQYVPVSLLIGSGSNGQWYYGPATTTKTDNSVTRSATWTVQSAMTLKSIFYRNASESSLLSNSNYPRLVDGGNIYTGYMRRLKNEVLTSPSFLLNGNTLWNGLVSNNASYDSYTETVGIDYPLCNPNERFICSYVSGSTTQYDSSFTGTGRTLEIRDKTTNNILRSFPTTQFTGFRTTYTPPSGSSGNDHSYYYARLVNTGSKNVLIQPAYGGTALNIWQIPDTATEDPIPIAATALENQCNYFSSTNSNSDMPSGSKIFVIGSYMSWFPNQTATNSSRGSSICRVNDDFSVTTFPGYSGSAIFSPSDVYNYSSGKTFFYRRYQNTYGDWKTGSNNDGQYCPIYPNITAANFSTPIVLAEGDVLTVSYKIEVA